MKPLALMTEIFNLNAFVCKLRNERLEGRRRNGEDKRIHLIPPVRRMEKVAINSVVPLGWTERGGVGREKVKKPSCCGVGYSEFQDSRNLPRSKRFC